MSRHPYEAYDPGRDPDAAATVGHHPYGPVPGARDPYAYPGAPAGSGDDPAGNTAEYEDTAGHQDTARHGGTARYDDTSSYDDRYAANRLDDANLYDADGSDGTGYDPAADLWDEYVPEPAARRRRPRPRTVAMAVLALVVAGLAAVTVPSYLDLRAARAAEAAGAAAMKAARAYVPDLMSYDYRTVDADFARARAHTTGSLTDHYRRLEATLGPVIKQRRTVQRVEVRGVAVESAAPGRAVVLILLNRTTTSTPPGAKAAKREVATGRVRLVMVKTDKSDKAGSAWSVSDLTTLLGNVPPAL